MDTAAFLDATEPLIAADAVAALLVLDDGRYLVQLRDEIPTIFYPGHWGLFGGGIEPGETPGEALFRELDEELALRPKQVEFFTRFDFDLTVLGQKKVLRLIYEVPITAHEAANVVLGEGAAVGAFTAEDLLVHKKMTAYDGFAVWLHHARGRFAGAPSNTS
jgi:8-oxo-dGTP pyrophosphatase MutT (NUDIX family)